MKHHEKEASNDSSLVLSLETTSSKGAEIFKSTFLTRVALNFSSTH